MWLRFLGFPLALAAGVVAAALLVLGLVVVLAYPNLPELDALTAYQPKIPLRIYTADGTLIGEFGEERRAVVAIADVPPLLKHAIIAAEDERFYQHPGIDYIGVLRAAYTNLVYGGRRQGASTITMQVARNFFLSSEKTLTRKLYEALLAFKIEHSLNKEQILELYVNQIYLGQRAYGFGAASQTYFGKSLDQLSLGEIAMLAGLPKAPSLYNPIANPQRAKQRQGYVLRRMSELGYITAAQYDEATKAPLRARREVSEYSVHAEFLAEMVRQALAEHYPEDVYTRGFRVYTTLRKGDQEAAYDAVRKGALEYDRRQGYRGPEGFYEMRPDATEDEYDDALADHPDSDDLLAAITLSADAKQVEAGLRSGEKIVVTGEGLRFAARSLEPKTAQQKRIRRGSIIRVQREGKNWQIVQLPEIEAAFISLDPQDGAIRSLVGGFDFGRTKFNHVTQAWRQPGSSFKPFIYSAALEKGFTPATVIPDEPVVLEAEETGSQRWEPKNFDGKFEGPMRMRTALTKSKNMVSIRILDAIGAKYAQEYVTRFGFDADRHPPYLTMALGAGAVTMWQLARGYSVFANGGFLVQPYFIHKIVDDRGNVLALAEPKRSGDEALRVIDARNAFIMDNMMQDVTRVGTAARAARLGRSDLAGKTGTTNEFVDAWFAGYQPTLVAIAWVGFDQPKTLGRNQTGGVVALPIWVSYMEKALKDVPEMPREMPPGIVVLPTGPYPTAGGESSMVPEFFYQKAVPPPEVLQPGPNVEPVPAPSQPPSPPA
ncbi:MAG: penicillin-binding protein 1A [Betaproteobacteria bacterium]|nr:penicillin-binding protein 1A [Betaproteobacteria bacterium]MBV9361469.1 penicillin-binding protein 1A [Betaproteobacteria bacterium]